MEVEHGVAAGAAQSLQPLHPQHDILQRAVQLAQLGVEHVGVYNDQIVDPHGEFLMLGAEPAVAIGNEKQLGTAVSVEVGVPLLRILSFGEVVQPRGAPARRPLVRLGEAVLGTAQTGHPLNAILRN